MKWAVYSLAAAMFAGLVGVSYSNSNPPVRPAHQTKSLDRHEVYVDIQKLVQLHPRWEMLSEMKATLSDAQAVPGNIGSPEQIRVSTDSVADVSGPVKSESRQDLEAETARKAIRALGQLESDRHEALRSRSAAMRETMIDNADVEIQAETQKIETSAAEKLRKIAQASSSEQLNAQMKVSALQHAVKLPGVKTSDLQNQLCAAQDNLDRVNKSTQIENSTIESDVKQEIEALRVSSHEKVGAALSIYESSEGHQIEDAMTAARDQALRELSRSGRNGFNMDSKAAADLNIGHGSAVKLTALKTASAAQGTQDALWMRGQINDLEARIVEDVKRMVRDLADKKDIEVKFSRGKSSIPDDTQLFYDLMRRSDWSACGPMILNSHGS